MPTSLHVFIFLSILISITDGTQLILVNNCKESVWPGILGSAGHPSPKDGGFHLCSGEEVVLEIPEGWSGRIWGREGCCFDPKTGKGSCETGDCAGLLKCSGIGGVPPATLVEMTLGTSQSALHFYDVSLVDGFNLPVSMKPVGGGAGCGVAACEANLNVCCPSALVVQRRGKARLWGARVLVWLQKLIGIAALGSLLAPKAVSQVHLLAFSRQFVLRLIATLMMIQLGLRRAKHLAMSLHFAPRIDGATPLAVQILDSCDVSDAET